MCTQCTRRRPNNSQPSKQSVDNHSLLDQSINQSIDRSIELTITQSTNQSIYEEPVNWSIYQSTERTTKRTPAHTTRSWLNLPPIEPTFFASSWGSPRICNLSLLWNILLHSTYTPRNKKDTKKTDFATGLENFLRLELGKREVKPNLDLKNACIMAGLLHSLNKIWRISSECFGIPRMVHRPSAGRE